MMAHTTCLSSLIAVVVGLVFVTLQQTALGSELINNICLPPVDGFSSPSQYKTNVISLLKRFANVNASDGFDMGGVGPLDSQRVYGLINCRPDVSASDCRDCAMAASKVARIVCPGNQGAVLWYDDCLLKYSSDVDFLGFDDIINRFWMSASPVSGDPTQFNSRVQGLLNKLINKAVTNPKLFAKGKTKADSNTTVYGMVECTRDLGSGTCQASLQDILRDGFPVCCSGDRGGRYVTPSTMFRFEIYPF